MGAEVVRVLGREVQLPLDAEAVEALNLASKWVEDARKRLAASYYADGLLSLGQAARLSGLPYGDFVAYLRERRVPLDYAPDDLAHDVEELKRLGLWSPKVCALRPTACRVGVGTKRGGKLGSGDRLARRNPA